MKKLSRSRMTEAKMGEKHTLYDKHRSVESPQ
ncbi:hypothetical protein KAI60_01785 [Candidatus Bathyarchaeota archaeon]|nr:hypothetical protein [Candidatus Bathyarchaeota archaeon]MCK5625718.1 hypothetical protein [Candidatus Bathyarchaeota archaeon]